jgi:hypothetical protein
MSLAAPDLAVARPAAWTAHEPAIWAGAFGAATLAGCAAVAAAPLAAYVWLIALFGIPHVVSELRYCDERFSGRSPRAALAAIGALLAGLAGTRLLGTYGVLSGFVSGPLELAFGSGLALAAAFFMRRWKLVGFLAACGVAYGALQAPFVTFLVWAWLHNLTPLAFVAEALDGPARRQALAALCVPFFVVPGLVALGGLDLLTQTLFAHDAARAGSDFGAGSKPLQAFLPAGSRMSEVLPLFQAAVVSQVMHYVAVIALLPRLLATGARREGRLAPWPRWPVFYALLAAAGLGSLAFYFVDFGEARSAYALAAALHSWIELPIFLMALGGGFSMRRAAQSRPEPMPR